MKYKYEQSQVETAVKNSHSYAEVFRALSIKINGGSYSWLKRMILRFGIDISHFDDPKTLFAKNRGQYQSLKNSVIADELPSTQRRKAINLRRFMLRHGMPMICAKCKLTEWLQKPLVLDIDHIDENCLNNHIGNLQFLCPNCHRQK